MIQDDSRWFKMIPDDSRWFQMIPDDSRWFQMIPDDSRWFKMIPDDSRWFQMIQASHIGIPATRSEGSNHQTLGFKHRWWNPNVCPAGSVQWNHGRYDQIHHVWILWKSHALNFEHEKNDEKCGDGSKPWYLVNPKIAGKWMFIPLKMYL